MVSDLVKTLTHNNIQKNTCKWRIVFFYVFFICVFFLPAPYGTSISRMPVNMGPSRQHGFMMDPHAGKLKVNIYFLYVIYLCTKFTDYGRPMKLFFIEIPNFGADKFLDTWGILTDL